MIVPSRSGDPHTHGQQLEDAGKGALGTWGGARHVGPQDDGVYKGWWAETAISVARTGGTMLKLEPVPAAQLLSMAAQQAAPLVNEAGLQMELQHESELPTIHVDADRMMRVFGNLLDNALKFTEPGGRIVLRAEPAPGAVLFSIANSGPAVPPADLERLFQPFWQAGRDDRRGAGLGLSICRSIIEAHGGTVWTESAEGMRLKILFLLPRGRPRTAASSLPQGQALGL